LAYPFIMDRYLIIRSLIGRRGNCLGYKNLKRPLSFNLMNRFSTSRVIILFRGMVIQVLPQEILLLSPDLVRLNLLMPSLEEMVRIKVPRNLARSVRAEVIRVFFSDNSSLSESKRTRILFFRITASLRGPHTPISQSSA
jgi:hypothetical protein